MLDAARKHFEPIFVEKDEEPELVAKYEVVYFPAFVWIDGAGEELTRSVQPSTTDELLEELELARDTLLEVADSGD